MTADAPLFGRRARVTVKSMTVPLFDEAFDSRTEEGDVTGVAIENNRIEFDIDHTLSKHPSQCTIKITNLSEETRSAFKKTPLQVTLEAGYMDDIAVIFRGDVTYVLSALVGTEWITTIQVGDGDRVMHNARVNRSYGPKTQYGTILSDVFKDVGQHIPDAIKNSSIFTKLTNGGMSLVGKYKDVVPGLLKPFGYKMTIQDGQPVIHRNDEVDGQTFLLSEQTGVLGSPEIGKPSKKGKSGDITITSLLYPQIRPGRGVRVDTRDVKGLFKVKRVRHHGDTHGGDWATETTIVPLPTSSNSRKSPPKDWRTIIRENSR